MQGLAFGETDKLLLMDRPEFAIVQWTTVEICAQPSIVCLRERAFLGSGRLGLRARRPGGPHRLIFVGLGAAAACSLKTGLHCALRTYTALQTRKQTTAQTYMEMAVMSRKDGPGDTLRFFKDAPERYVKRCP